MNILHQLLIFLDCDQILRGASELVRRRGQEQEGRLEDDFHTKTDASEIFGI